MKKVLLNRSFFIPVAILIILGALLLTGRFVLLDLTKSTLVRGEVPKYLLYFADEIDSKTFQKFFSKSKDTKEQGYVICLLGWTQRTDMLDQLENLANSEEQYSQHAILSIVAIEKKISFPCVDFADEFFRDYAKKAAIMAKEKSIPLREAAVIVAEGLRD